MTRRAIENLVIGGGPAGSMAALRLAESGRDVVLVEKERGPHHKVCGEFLSGEAVAYLQEAGIDLHALGARTIGQVRLHSGQRAVEALLPFRAMSLSRCALDEAMLTRARVAGCAARRGVVVASLTREGELWRADVRGGEPIWARAVFLATGKHEVRGWPRGRGTQPDLVGFKMHWKLRPKQSSALRGVMELFLFTGGYGGMSLVEGDAVTLCFVIQRKRLQQAGGWARVLQTIRDSNRCLQERLEGAEALYEKPLAISPIPYGYLGGEDRGVWCVGDQAAVIPSFTGDGMSIALHSAALAVQMYVAGQSIAEFNDTLRAQLRPNMRLASWLSRMMVSGAGRRLAPMVLTVAPRGLRWIAGRTRIQDRALAAIRESTRSVAAVRPA